MQAETYAPPRRMEESTRARLAERPDTAPEMLFFLANDPAIGVRAAIAANAATPPLADQLLARDSEPGVRRVLARKLATLAPLLDPGSTDRHGRVLWETLRLLAEDGAVAVRAALTELVAEQPDVPRLLILRLARDVAMAVAEPVLRGSPLLGEEDLLALIADPPVPGTLRAIARRPNLPEAPSDAIAARDDGDAITALLANATACIREVTLLALAARSSGNPAWQGALARRPGLGEEVLRGLCGVLAEEWMRVLLARTDLDPALALSLRPAAAPGPVPPPPSIDEDGFLRAARQGHLPDCARILGALSGLPAGVVSRVLAARDPAPLVALCWKAGLSGRAATFAQIRLTGSAPEDLLVLPGGGWALSEARMGAIVDGLLVRN